MLHTTTTNKKIKRDAVGIDSDAWHHVCNHIRLPRDIHALSQVCFASRIAANSASLWKAAYVREFGPPPTDIPTTEWKKSVAAASRGVHLCMLKSSSYSSTEQIRCLNASHKLRLLREKTVWEMFHFIGNFWMMPPHKLHLHLAEHLPSECGWQWRRLEYRCLTKVGELAHENLLVVCITETEYRPLCQFFRPDISSIDPPRGLALLPNVHFEIAREALKSVGVNFGCTLEAQESSRHARHPGHGCSVKMCSEVALALTLHGCRYSEIFIDAARPARAHVSTTLPGCSSVQLGTPDGRLTLAADIDLSVPSGPQLVVGVSCVHALDFLRRKDEENLRATRDHVAQWWGASANAASRYLRLVGEEGVARFPMRFDKDCKTHVFKRVSRGEMFLVKIQHAEWSDHLKNGVEVVVVLEDLGLIFEQRSYSNLLALQTVIIL
jgi:hypothetical protein